MTTESSDKGKPAEKTAGSAAASASTSSGSEVLTPKEERVRDLMASLVVFLVALPLCIGIAVACGVPAERGLVTGMVGGAIGIISGAPLLVSGPAASLIVPCFALVSTYGLLALGPVVMLTGVWQMLAGYFRLGQWFRAVAPAVITGMLTGIGVLIIGSQALVALDFDPKSDFIENVSAVPAALYATATGEGAASTAPFWISVATVALIIGWTRFRPKLLAIIPGHLVALLSVTAAAYYLDANVRNLDISSNFFAGLDVPSLDDFKILGDFGVIGRSLVFAFVASAATLLTANAIDERQTIVKTDYDKEMRAQGVGNFFAGLVGGLPMTGVIVRSSVNVDAGARTRRSTILHAIWLLLFCSLAPQLLELIPRASLGAILVYTGIKLVDVGAMGRLWAQGRAEFLIFAVTIIGVVFLDLFIGILAGLGAAALKIVWTFSRLEIREETGPKGDIMHMHLEGAATFLQLPRLARALEVIPTDRELHVHIDRLDHIDHACLQLLSSWGRQREGAGQPGLVVEWDELTNRYKKALVGTGPATRGNASPSIVNLVWAEMRRVYSNEEPPPSRPPQSGDSGHWDRWIDADAIELRVQVGDLTGVLEIAAGRLASLTGLDAAEIAESLNERNDGHVPLGDGVSLPHAAIDGIDRSRVAVITTPAPINVGDDQADIFFVLVSPTGDPSEHLRALAHIGRMCHRSPLLAQLRKAPDATYAATVLDALGREAAPSEVAPKLGRSLALLSVDGEAHAARLKSELSEAFDNWTLVTKGERNTFTVLHAMGGAANAGAILLASIERHEEPLLKSLVDEANKLDDSPVQVTILRDEHAPSSLRGMA